LFVLFVFSTLLLSLLVGGMVFFPSVVAPTVFKALEADAARTFLRALFPRYYAFVAATSLVSSLGLAVLLRIPEALGLALVSLSTLWVRQRLMPQINDARDASLAGDASATRRFQKGHALSVRINLVQLLVAFGVLGWLLSAGGLGS
jgi:hypothetical protein